MDFSHVYLVLGGTWTLPEVVSGFVVTHRKLVRLFCLPLSSAHEDLRCPPPAEVNLRYGRNQNRRICRTPRQATPSCRHLWLGIVRWRRDFFGRIWRLAETCHISFAKDRLPSQNDCGTGD